MHTSIIIKKKVYLLGIGGIAMANLACLLKKKGYSVSGSDLDTFGPSAELLKKHDIKYFKNHSPNHIKKFEPDVVIIGNAIKRGNPGLEYVLNEQVPYRSMPEAIREEVIGNRKAVVITGTSGKTTVAALIAWILQEAGLKPTALIGGIMNNTGSGLMSGNGEYAVIEGDEYGSSFYDSSPKFIHYRPYLAVINNIQPDHLDVFGDIENIYKSFQKLIQIIPQNGRLVLNSGDPHTADIIKEAGSSVITFGGKGAVRLNEIKFLPDGISFSVFRNKKRLGKITSALLGGHNADNILAAIAVCLGLKVPFKEIARSIAGFRGVKRRLEIIYKKDGVTIIDDFAHNPEKVSASLSALRSHFPGHQIVAVFEPRTGSSRRNFFQSAYPPSFKNADLAYIADPYKKSALNKKEAFSSRKLAEDLNNSGVKSYALGTADNIIAHLKNNFLKTRVFPAIICVMTSGEFDGIHQKLVEIFSGTNS